MDREVTKARGTPSPAMPWLSSYPPGVPSEIAAAPYPLLGRIARDLAARHADIEAFTTVMPNGMSASLTFAEVDRYSSAFAAYLRETLRLRPGSRVAIQMPNGLAYPVVAFGIFKAGCVIVNVNPLYTPSEMTHVFSDADLAAIVCIDMFADKLAAAMARAPVPHVIMSEAAAFFPKASRLLIGFMQKYVKKQIPKALFPCETLARALAIGEDHIEHGTDIEAYSHDLEPSSVACLQYTGGTTGVSKGTMLTHSNLIMNAEQFLSFSGDDISERDTILTALPLYHIFAFTVNFLGFFMRGARNILVPSPRPLTNLRKVFEKEAITFVTGVNTLFNGLLNESWFCNDPPKRLRKSVAGGMALQTAVAERWHQVTGTPVFEGYGLTEASPVLTCNPKHRPKAGSIGVPLPATEIRCVDDQGREVAVGDRGELIARGPQVMAGYWRQPRETAGALRDGWLYTGDIATMDEEGYFTIIDRRKDMILVSGFNIYPNEVEAVLATHPAVKECAVIGVPDETSGEAVKAFIVSSDPALNARTIRSFCRAELSSYKVPKYVEFRDELPKSNVGKILRKDLRAEECAKRGT